jgi:hypothetical protein
MVFLNVVLIGELIPILQNAIKGRAASLHAFDQFNNSAQMLQKIIWSYKNYMEN